MIGHFRQGLPPAQGGRGERVYTRSRIFRVLGHASLAMTMRYAHLSQRHEADAVAKLDAKLAKNRNTSENEEAELIEIPRKQAASGLYVT